MATKKKRKKVKKPTAPKKRRGVSPSKTAVRKPKKAMTKLRTAKRGSDGRFRGKGSKGTSKGRSSRKSEKANNKRAKKRLSAQHAIRPNPRLITLQKSLEGPGKAARNIGLSANPAHKVNRDGSIDVQLRLGNFAKGAHGETELGKFVTQFIRSAGPIRYRGVRVNAQLFMAPGKTKAGIAGPEQYLRMVGSLPTINMQYRRLDNFLELLSSLQNSFRTTQENGWDVQYITINLRYDPEWK